MPLNSYVPCGVGVYRQAASDSEQLSRPGVLTTKEQMTRSVEQQQKHCEGQHVSPGGDGLR